MAVGTMYATMPAVAAAVGLYFLDKQHSNTKELGSGFRASMKNSESKAKEEVKITQMPKLAPQFDGLYCFETLVGH
ncbi:hypothetical protein L1049_021268 [Liquidambar formosana]|uniref:Uncharacterized protein n=1 Tax=Liquidambar formosana TaxID=63359 RepID=A0AAP0X6T2_LIQFO